MLWISIKIALGMHFLKLPTIYDLILIEKKRENYYVNTNV